MPTPAPQARPSAAFSLLELLAVTLVIGLLAALVLPALGRTKVQAQKQQARLQERQIISALIEYQSFYGLHPVSSACQERSAKLDEDVTFGGFCDESQTWLAGPCYTNDNSEVMPALLDLEHFGDGTPSSNRGHAQNPRRTRFLEARQPGGTNALPGVGIDGIYRDPWRSPYVITLDLNGDGRARDVIYREPTVSQDPETPERGLNGFLKIAGTNGNPIFEAPGPVLVWSPGPDRHLNSRAKANEGVNRDNILSSGP